MRDAWSVLTPGYVDAEYDVFLTTVRHRPDVLRPYVVVLEHESTPCALAVGRIEKAPFTYRFGYWAVYRPKLRVLRIVHGGIAGAADDDIGLALVRCLERALADGEADVLVIPAVRPESPFYRAVLDTAPSWRRQRLGEPRAHRRLTLPATYEEFLAGRDRKSRYNLKRQATLLQEEFGDRLRVEILRKPTDHARIVQDLDAVAEKTYQRGLGAGFADTVERRELVKIGLDRGWFRAWLLSIDDKPVAFWQGTARGPIFFVNSTGFDPAYGSHGVGSYLQQRMFEDLCADEAIQIVDFGWGDADYKRRFGTESWDEYDVVVFAPSFRGVTVNTIRSAVAGLDWGARRALAATGGTNRLKRFWRSRLRQPPR